MNLYVNDVNWKTEGEPEVPTLQDICLKCILENLSSFNTEFLKVKDQQCEQQVLFQIFRRKYSQKIINTLVAQRRSLHERYFELLINEHLTELDSSIFEPEHFSGVLQRMENGNNLENVSFEFKVQDQPRRQVLKQVVRDALQHLRNVKVIQIRDYCDNVTLATIYSLCKELKKLCLIHCSITDIGLRSLCDEKSNPLNLQTLVLKDISRNCDDGISYLLRNMQSLECVYYENLLDVLYNEGRRKNSIANLTSLGFYVKGLEGMDYLRKALTFANNLCPSISKVNIHGKISGNQLQMLHIFSNLNAVYVCTGNNTLDVSNFLKHFGNKMKSLKISRCNLRLSTLFENCANMESVLLKEIDYDFTENQNSGCILSNMTSFVMYQPYDVAAVNRVTEKFLNSCPSLTEIDITGYNDNQQTGGIVETYCATSRTLEKLAFARGSIESQSLRTIVWRCATLRIVIAPSLHARYKAQLYSDINAIQRRNFVIKLVAIHVKVKEEDMESNCCICNA